ncbi:hypothetical protein chiPu_0024219, partial [Chiloscyllium punctatum]|nr:hypothetical protein [Chiloscyllium punctatum]
FLLANERHVAKEIRDEYVDTMSKIYFSYFKSYSSRLMKVQYEEVADKDDLMGVEDTAKKGFFSKPSLKNRNTIFTLGNRGNVISSSELEAPIIVPHAAQKSDVRVRVIRVKSGICNELQVVDLLLAMSSPVLSVWHQTTF